MMPDSDATIQSLRKDFPFPWQTQVSVPRPGIPGGIVRMIDATGKEIPMFAMTRLAELTTAHIESMKMPGESTK